MANLQERRDKNGKLISYSIRVHRGRGADGKQLKPWTATFEVSPTWKEESARKKAEAFAATFEKECREGTTSDSRRRFDEYCDYVIDLKENRGAKHKTIASYRDLTKRIYPEIGHLKLKDIRADDLNRLYTKLSKTTVKSTIAKSVADLPAILKEKHLTRAGIAKSTGLSESTVSAAVRGDTCSVKTAQKIADALNLRFEKTFLVVNENHTLSAKTVTEYHRLISTVLRQAVKDGLIPFNVAANAEPPKVTQKEVESLQSADLPAILAALEREPLKWRVITHLLLITGCRRGEIVGLRWPDVDFKGNQLRISNNVLYASDIGVYQDTPKTEDSVRLVAVPQATIKLLEDWQTVQKADAKKKGELFKNPDQLLFTQENGSPMHPDSVTSWLDRFAKRNNLPHIYPHKFRHTMASMLIYNKVDVVSVSKRLGHSKVSTTTDIYSHVLKEADRQNAEILESVFLKRA
ncbi:MAG: tyrosine-type recombinase/integrase [Oscillospiraceae bacterium]|nr:tyrosine-type recombinase/integrase [Oscillospiraceae bacterium]